MKKLLQKYYRYYKVRQNLLQTLTGITKCDNYKIAILFCMTCKYIRLLMFSLSKYFTLNNLFRFTSKRIFSHELICLMVLKSKISLIVHKKNFSGFYSNLPDCTFKTMKCYSCFARHLKFHVPFHIACASLNTCF